MDEKNNKKRESIDDILSDLNGLLNKMPSILDGIKMPELKPVEFGEKKEAAQPPATKNPAGSEADKTVVPPPFSGLPQGDSAPAPEPKPEVQKVAPGVLPDPFDADKTMVLEPFSGLQIGEPAPAEGAAAAATVSAGKEEPPAADGADFGIPDIESLMKLSEDAVSSDAAAQPAPAVQAPEISAPDESPAQEEPAAEAAPETGPEAGELPAGLILEPETAAAPPPAEAPAEGQPVAAAEEPSLDDLAEFERQMTSGAPAIEDGLQTDPGLTPETAAEAVPSSELQPAEFTDAVQFEPQSDASAETMQLEPAADSQQQAAEPEPQSDASAETIQLEPAGDSQEQPIQFESFDAQPAAEEAAAIPADALEATLQPEAQPAAPELSVGGGFGLPQGDQPPGLSADSGEPMLTVGGPADASAGDGDKTMVMAAPSGTPEEEKTVIFQAASSPGLAATATSGDLAELSAKQTPAGIPDERVRSLFLLYSPQDAALCASLLAELDAVCLRSQTAPMFIRRAGVNVFDPDMNSNFVLQTVTDSGATGLLCVGGVPQEKVYEIENVFSGSPVLFRHMDAESFSHSAVLNLVLDMIVR